MDDQPSLTQRIFKRLTRPFYSLFSQKLVSDLKVQETQDMLLQINHRVFTVENELQKLKSIQSATNLLLSGRNTHENPLYQKYSEAALEVYDLASTIDEPKRDPKDIVAFFDHSDVELRGKTVMIVGGTDPLYATAATRRGAKQVIRIVATSQMSGQTKNGDVQFVYPFDLAKLQLEQVDILLIPDPNWTTLLTPRAFAGIGGFIKEAIVIAARVVPNTVFSDTLEPAILEQNGRISFNDNYLRQQLHRHGFVEVQCSYTSGNNIDNSWDKKVTKFNHLKGFSVITKNAKPKKKTPKIPETPVEKIYIGYKLPRK